MNYVIANYKEECRYDKQCQANDINSICSKVNQQGEKQICQCADGFYHNTSLKKCKSNSKLIVANSNLILLTFIAITILDWRKIFN